MIRTLASCLWFVAALALGFEAAADPCQTVSKMQVEVSTTMDVQCADMAMGHEMPDEQDRSDHETAPCCCAALLGQAVQFDGATLEQPILYSARWAVPLPEQGSSELLDYEPPPPRV